MLNTRTLTDFIADLNSRGGPLPTNRYWVDIGMPPIAYKANTPYPDPFVNFFREDLTLDPRILNHLGFACENAQLSGKSLATSDIRIQGYTHKIPYDQIFEDLTLSFVGTSNAFEERLFFEAWLNNIVNPVNQLFNFRSEYGSTIHVTTRSKKSGAPTFGLKFYKAYPIAIATQDLSFANENDYVRLQVTFTCEGYLPDQLTPRPSSYTNVVRFEPALLERRDKEDNIIPQKNINQRWFGIYK